MRTGVSWPVQRVAVDPERREQVVGADALQALEGLQRDGRVGVPLPDVGDGRARQHGLAGADRGVWPRMVHVHVVQPVGGAGGRDVALDVRRLERALGRRHLQRLQQRRVDDADDQRHEGPDPDGEHRQRPALAADVEEEDARREDRDVDQQQLGRQPGVHVGVAGAVDVAVLRVDERPALQHVAGRLVQRDERQQHRDVGLHGRSHPRQAPLGLDPAVEVVEDDRRRRASRSGWPASSPRRRSGTGSLKT